MAPDWPNTITSRHHHLCKRAEAYASATYYSECSLSGISPDGAAAAEVMARSRHSKWWLNGSDPNHPSHRLADVKEEEVAASAVHAKAVTAEENPNPNEVARYEEDVQTDDENDSDIANNQEEDEEPLDAGSNAPIRAQDDDLGSSFGTLNSFYAARNASHNAGSNNMAAQSNPTAVSTHSSLLPSWLTGSHTAHVVTPEVLKQVHGSTEEVINSYHYSNPSLLLNQEKMKEEAPLTKSPAMAVAEVTSESEADDSIYSKSSLLSSDDTTVFYPRSRFRYVESNFSGVARSRKSDRGNFSIPLDQTFLDAQVNSAKAELLLKLENEGTGPSFQKALASLGKYAKMKTSPYKKRKLSNKSLSCAEITDIDGTWLMISPPEYPSCLGKNSQGESMFTLGRMTFEMYQPSDLVCSIQKQYNTIKSVEKKDLPRYVPKSLRREVENERNGEFSGRLKTYNIIASFTIESLDDEPKKLRGIMTNYGYALPDPALPARKSIWFTGGTIEPADDDAVDEWKKIFGSASVNIGPSKAPEFDASEKPSLVEAEKARILASKILLGAVHEPIDEQGIVGFHLNRPIGGHGNAYCDIVYMDDELRIMRGHSGSIYVFKRA